MWLSRLRNMLLPPVLAVAALMPAMPVVAQETGCETLPGFSGFDFWVGEWDVFDFATGTKVGENSVRKLEQDCLLLESWQGEQGSTGTSMNYYNPVTRQWRQLWVSSGRYAIDIVGGLRAGAMILEGSIYNFAGAVWNFRGTWTPQDDGSVRQFFEQYNHDAEVWEPWFDGRYVRQSR